MWVCALLLATVADAATLKTKVSPVQKVIELLDDLKAKVQADLAAEETIMGEYTKWCDSEANTKEDAITSAKRTIADLEAAITDSAAQILALSAEADELATKISTAEADLESATYIRDGERKAFEGSEHELVETTDTLSRALVVLKRGQSFLQKGGDADLVKLAEGLRTVIASTWVNEREKSVVQSLLQSEDEDLSLQPQATAAAYASQGSGILGTLGDLKDKAEESLSAQRKTEMQASHEYEMLKASLDTELGNMKDRLQDVANERSGEEAGKGGNSEELAETQKSLAADEAYLADLHQSCATKAREWSERQQQAADEQGAIAKAKEVLADGVKVFLQVSHKDRKADSGKLNQVAALIQALAAKAHGYALTQLAAEVQSDTFGKVKDLIEAMVDRLMKEAAEEADANSFCEAEVAKSRKKAQKLSATQDMHAVRIEKAAAGQAKLAEQIKALQAEVAEIDASTQVATALRQKEAAEFASASAEYAQSAEAVGSAIGVLQAYYSSGAFVQVRSAQAPEFNSAKSDIGSTIVELLEVAESDFQRMLAESTAAESAAKSTYDDLSHTNAVSRAAKLEEAKGKGSEVKSLEMSLTNYKEDHASTAKELDAVLTYLDKLKPQCETKVMSYAERKSKREAEIAGLKEALGILEG